jgi:hypothetical protein
MQANDDKLGKMAKVLSGVAEDAKKGAQSFIQQTQNLAIWGGMLTYCLLVFIFLSSKDFSFLLTLAALWRCFGLGVLNFKIWSSKSAKSVSVKTLELYGFVFTARLISIVRHQGTLSFFFSLPRRIF